MPVTFLPAAGRAPVPWRNGGGVTREVAASGAGGDFDWRISVADVAADGPFSAFDGHDRIITLVRGAGMTLTVDGTANRIDEPYRPFAFPGGATTGCVLVDGPVVDFNVMTRSTLGPATVVFHRPAGPLEVAGPAVVMVFEGTAAAGFDLGPLDAVLVGAGAGVVVTPGPDAPVLAVIALP